MNFVGCFHETPKGGFYLQATLLGREPGTKPGQRSALAGCCAPLILHFFHNNMVSHVLYTNNLANKIYFGNFSFFPKDNLYLAFFNIPLPHFLLDFLVDIFQLTVVLRCNFISANCRFGFISNCSP